MTGRERSLMHQDKERNDSTVCISELRQLVRSFVEKRNWQGFHHPKELAVSIAVETAELLEIFQWEDKLPIDQIKRDAEIIGRLKDEIADVLIYILSLANQVEIDVSSAILEKLAKNDKRYSVDEVLRTGRYRKDRVHTNGANAGSERPAK